MILAEILAAIILVALVAYAVFGGADFGGGVWDLCATGPRKQLQRWLVQKAIAPVWEANHVWLILAVVLLFSAFPVAYAAISIALHLPLTFVLLGIVARGAAFVFRQYGPKDADQQAIFGRTFAVASLVTPLGLGVIIGALTLGRIEMVAGAPKSGFVEPWLSAFPFLVGGFAIALFAFTAAVFLTTETTEPTLQEDFRRRAFLAGAAVGVFALLAASTAGTEAAPFERRLFGSWWSYPVQIVAGISAITTFAALYARKFRVARLGVITQVAAIVGGWGLAQAPYLVPPKITVESAAAPEATLELLLVALGAGSILLFPSLYWLFKVFKSRQTTPR